MISSTTNSAGFPEAEIDRVGSEPFADHNISPRSFHNSPRCSVETDGTAD